MSGCAKIVTWLAAEAPDIKTISIDVTYFTQRIARLQVWGLMGVWSFVSYSSPVS